MSWCGSECKCLNLGIVGQIVYLEFMEAIKDASLMFRSINSIRKR